MQPRDNELHKRHRDKHESDGAESMERDGHQRPAKKVMMTPCGARFSGPVTQAFPFAQLLLNDAADGGGGTSQSKKVWNRVELKGLLVP